MERLEEHLNDKITSEVIELITLTILRCNEICCWLKMASQWLRVQLANVTWPNAESMWAVIGRAPRHCDVIFSRLQVAKWLLLWVDKNCYIFLLNPYFTNAALIRIVCLAWWGRIKHIGLYFDRLVPMCSAYKQAELHFRTGSSLVYYFWGCAVPLQAFWQTVLPCPWLTLKVGNKK